MARPIIQLTVQEFLDGYAQGYITDVFTVTVSGQQRVYGHDVRGTTLDYLYKIVWCAP